MKDSNLGSTAITANSSGAFYSEVRYMLLRYAQDRPGVRGNLRLRRYTSGTTPTTYRFMGQKEGTELKH